MTMTVFKEDAMTGLPGVNPGPTRGQATMKKTFEQIRKESGLPEFLWRRKDDPTWDWEPTVTKQSLLEPRQEDPAQVKARAELDEEKRLRARNRFLVMNARKKMKKVNRTGQRWDSLRAKWIDVEEDNQRRLAEARERLEAQKMDYTQLSMAELVDRYNAAAKTKNLKEVKKFESRAVAERRCREIETEPALSTAPEAVPQPAPETVPKPASEVVPPEESEEMVARRKTKTARSATRVRGKPAKRIGEFKPVRTGTDRATVVQMADGSHTMEQIAKKIGKGRQTVNTILFCLNRDNGFGYEMLDGDKPRVLLPAGKTRASAIEKDVA